MTSKEWCRRFAKVLTTKMKSANITQKELSELAHISETTISRYISGTQIPKATNVINIAKVLNCTIMELMQFGEIVV